MRFALIDNKRKEAEHGLKGLCPGCSQPVIAKCGNQRIWHWAHRSNKICDNWWEPETEWHRSWKNNYPADWQEVFLLDEKTGVKHVADLRTVHNLIIEFQHSHIDPKERATREKFYQNMVWVVDGTRLKRDYPRFRKGIESFRRTNKQGFYFVDFPDEVFPTNWLGSSVPIILDFQGITATEQHDVIKNTLWCLLPQRIENLSVVVGIGREQFIEITHNSAQLFQEKQEEKEQKKEQQKQSPEMHKMRREPQYIYERGRWKRRQRF